ncbi:agamous-like MADS-box protein AGL62 [Tripterygium wilfordii]|uniref:agamous-like MADS-box protein AGL62 n=1 Tax=Tripterygium wilfordii TaxID=458696 RepID=UPI0018F7E544|nr:agamous-like MADS-box protein AGL62 [Tripterygium wilfordii]
MARISRGRQKIEIKKMTNESNLHVTFSKRRLGIFKKASELCTLCDVDVAVLIFSPGKKVFSFGHKSVDSVIQRFVNGAPPISSGPTELIQAYRETTIRDLNTQLMEVLDQLEMEKKIGQQLSKMRKASQAEVWWQKPVSEMNKDQLEQLKLALEELQKNVAQQSQTTLYKNLNNAAESFASNFGASHVMLPTAGTSGVNDSAVDAFNFDSNVMPSHAAMPPTYDFGSGRIGFY